MVHTNSLVHHIQAQRVGVSLVWSGFFIPAYPDDHSTCITELDRVGDQIQKNLPEPGSIRFYPRGQVAR